MRKISIEKKMNNTEEKTRKSEFYHLPIVIPNCFAA
jgi:hypothetical protein